MASLWDKLTGKAPMVDSPEENKAEDTNKVSAETKGSNSAPVSQPSLLAKLTGKAPMVDDSVKTSTDGAQKTSIKDSKIAGAVKEHVFDNKDLKTVAMWALPIVICFVLIFIVKAIFTNINQPYNVKITEQNGTIITVSNDINAKNLEFQSLQSQESYREANNTSSDVDTTADDNVAIEFFKHYTTWDENPQEKYSAGRVYADLCNEFREYCDNNPGKIDESFKLCLLPDQQIYDDPDTGIRYYQVDFENRNLAFQSLQSYPITGSNAGGGNATQYASLITLSSKQQNGSVSYYHVYAVYTVDRHIENSPELTIQRVALLMN